jgi:CheY-like chemotaxis protein
VGHRAPADARAWMARPIDPLHVMRELDAMVAAAHPAAAPAAIDAPGTITQAVQRAQAAGSAPVRNDDPSTEAAPKAGVAASDTDDSALLQRRDPTPQPAPAPRPEPPVPPAPVPTAADATPPARPRPRKPAAPAPAPAPAPAVVMPPPSALLVDDSEVALRFLETRLQRWGMQIDRASSSRKAIELLAQRDYDFVFVDLELGEDSELDGLSLCQHIKRHQGEGAALGSSVFIVSAHQTELDRVRGALAGCDAYLGKPLQDIDLRRLLIRHGLEPPPVPPREDIEAI